MTTIDLDTMHRAVLLDPGDDLARLAYADACEEAGDVERAGFVRTQVEAERLREPGYFERHRLSDYGDVGVRVRRGFVESIALPLDAFMEHAGELFSRHPITAVTLTDRVPNGFQTPGDEMYGFWRWHGCVGDHGQPTDPSPDNLPPALWDAMKALNAHQRPEYVFDWSGWLWFDTPELAHAALSAACVAYGRRLAKLAPLRDAP